MELIKKFKKNEKGAITTMVLASMIFMLVIIGASYFGIVNKSGSQDRKIAKIAEEYKASDEQIENEYNKVVNEIEKLEMKQAQSDGMFEREINAKVTDSNGNEIVVPAGFKITEDATDVTKGIVIEDKEGNQFVWIPVGKVYINEEQTEFKTINLDRYSFAEDGTPTAQGTAIINNKFQELATSDKGNATAKDLDAFLANTKRNGGYYFGRYEAGVKNGKLDLSDSNGNQGNGSNWTGYKGENIQLVCKAGEKVWDYVTQNKASELSKNMYSSSKFQSDLVNSYAWYTAIVFIQEFSGDSHYSKQTIIRTDRAEKTGEATIDGINKDVRCNIYDMAGNLQEWSTETSSYGNMPCVYRGDSFRGGEFNTSYCYFHLIDFFSIITSFRPILYLEN